MLTIQGHKKIPAKQFERVGLFIHKNWNRLLQTERKVITMNKKFITMALASAMILTSASSMAVLAEDNAETPALISEPAVMSNYVVKTGTITEIRQGEDLTYYTIQGETEDDITVLMIADDTLLFDGKGEVKDAFEEGDEVKAYIDALSPAPLIYPPQYFAEAVIENTEDALFTDADVYTKTETGRYINAAATLEINVDGFEGELGDTERLLVFYSVTTRSLPPQTTPEKIVVLEDTSLDYNEEDTNDEINAVEEDEYVEKTGTVTEVNQGENSTYYTIQGETEEDITVLAVNENTLLFDAKGEVKDAFEAGDEITAYIDALSPAPAIYPPQYTAEVIIEKTEDAISTDIGVYTKTETGRYANADNTLEINVDEFEGELGDSEKLLVFYSITTMSIPPQTTPEKIVVLSDNSADNETGNVEDEVVINADNVSRIVAGDTVIEYTPIKIGSSYMLPLRAVAEAFGYEVGWSEVTQSVTVGTAYSLTVGSTDYIKGRMAPISLTQAPVMIEMGDGDNTYVPLNYFTEVMEFGAAVDGDALVLTDNSMTADAE